MKKKILFGLGTLTLVAVLTLNVSLTKNASNSGLSLNSIETVAQAKAEGGCSGTWLLVFYSPSYWVCQTGGAYCCLGWDF